MSYSIIRRAGLALAAVAPLAMGAQADASVLSLSTQVIERRAGVVAVDPGVVFPVDGAYRIGTDVSQRFGGARGHLGQDVFARCGTRVVAAHRGVVRRATYEAAAGNYLVVERRSGRSDVYMHLRKTVRAEEGDRVDVAQSLGQVGRTGDADGCHLHFEIWTAPGWYQGGEAVDPYTALRAAG